MSQPRLEDVADEIVTNYGREYFDMASPPIAALECNEQPLNIASTQGVNAAKEQMDRHHLSIIEWTWVCHGGICSSHQSPIDVNQPDVSQGRTALYVAARKVHSSAI